MSYLLSLPRDILFLIFEKVLHVIAADLVFLNIYSYCGLGLSCKFLHKYLCEFKEMFEEIDNERNNKLRKRINGEFLFRCSYIVLDYI